MRIFIVAATVLLSGGALGQRPGRDGPPPPTPNDYKPRPFQEKQQEVTQPPSYITPIPIISFNKQQSIDGSYKTSYETGNSITAEETGFLKNVGVKEEEALVQYGSYSYTDPDGRVISVSYTADEGGFRPTGDHLPTPPPVPPEVQKGLDIIYESIRLQAEQEASEKRYENGQLEAANFPAGNSNYARQRT